jgi:hypothetical protein
MFFKEGRMGVTHPSKITLLLDRSGICRLPIVRRTSGFLKLGFSQLWLPSPSVDLHFRRCLYRYLLSLETILQRIQTLYIKINLQNRKSILSAMQSTSHRDNVRLLRLDIGCNVWLLSSIEQLFNQYAERRS